MQKEVNNETSTHLGPNTTQDILLSQYIASIIISLCHNSFTSRVTTSFIVHPAGSSAISDLFSSLKYNFKFYDGGP